MGSVVNSISKAVTGAVSSVVKGVSEFAQSPLGQLAIQAGLAYVTGGSSLMAGGGLSSLLGGAGGAGAMGGLSSLFGGGGASNLISQFAGSFLGDSGSLLSQNGLGALGALTQGADSNQLYSILQSVMGAQGGQAQSANAQAGGLENLLQLFAGQHAQSIG